MIKLIILLTSMSPLLLSCQTKISVDKSELKAIYTQILISDSIKSKYFLIDSIENFKQKSITESDTSYHIANCEVVKNGLWSNELFDSARIISKADLRSISQPNPLTMTPKHYSFSLPYFAKDKNSFIIYYNMYCGNLCAEYSLRLYKKINGQWALMKKYFEMVS